MLTAYLVLGGCVTPGGSRPVVEAEAPGPQPQWKTTRAALGLEVERAESDGRSTDFSQSPDELQQQVRARCSEGKAAPDTEFLPPLVTGLYAAGIDPAASAEALIKADCAPIAEVVQELVAQGGAPAVAPVVNRALFLAGPGAEGLIESAASAGMQTDLGSWGRASPAEEVDVRYAMAYYPAGSAGGLLATSADGASLYDSANAGYGIYSFLLVGSGFEGRSEAERQTDRELLRVVETYVFASEAYERKPRQGAHAFLVPVHPGTAGEDLFGTLDDRLSSAMRSELSEYLRFQGRPDVARRLQTDPGPFLVSGLQPRLVPAGRGEQSARLLVDLSGIGAEYMYAVVDAYDRPIPKEMQGRAEGLMAIRARLLDLFKSAASGAPADQRVLTIGALPKVAGAQPPADSKKADAVPGMREGQ